MAEDRFLISRVDDLLAAAEGGRLAVSRFLSSREVYETERYLASISHIGNTLFFGGYADAERKKLFCLPEYAAGLCEDKSEILTTYFSEELSEKIVMLEITGSGYRKLSHKDYLGSVLSLGCERDAIGDICVTGESSAVLFCERDIARLVLSELERVASDKVRVRAREDMGEFHFERQFQRISDTVASPRLDSIVASLARLSRERARETVEAGLVELNYSEELRPDRAVEAGATLTIRGCGKFIVRDLSGRTSRGRVRLEVDKYC